MKGPTLEEKFKLLYESIGKPRCRNFSQGACGERCELKEDLGLYPGCRCEGNITECDYDEDVEEEI